MGAKIYRAERTVNGLCYKNERAFNNKRGVCYIPEYAFPCRPSGEVYGTAKECKNVYTYKDFLDLAEGNEKLARALFDEVDWQYPESRLYEMDIERENNHEVANMWSLACSDNLDNYELTIILLQLAYGKNYCRSAMHGLIKTIYEIEDIGDLTNEFRKDFMAGKTMNINNGNYEPILAIPGYYFVRYL